MNTPGNIRKATINDFPMLIDIEQRCFNNNLSYSKRQLWHLLTKAQSTVLISTHENHICGFIIVLYCKGTTVAGIETIDVDPAYQNQGIGSQLLYAAEQDMKQKGIKRIRLEVATTNQKAVRLYEKTGFIKIAMLKNYYQYDHEGTRDALRMIKSLQ